MNVLRLAYWLPGHNNYVGYDRMGPDHWQGTNGQPAITTKELLERLDEVLTIKPPPTPEERAGIMVSQFSVDFHITSWPHNAELRDYIAREIQAAIEADREAR